jgi:hypothetical protein
LLLFGVEYFVFQLAIQKATTNIYRNIILLLGLYGYDTWSLTFREEHRLRMFKNRVLRKIFGPRVAR